MAYFKGSAGDSPALSTKAGESPALHSAPPIAASDNSIARSALMSTLHPCNNRCRCHRTPTGRAKPSPPRSPMPCEFPRPALREDHRLVRALRHGRQSQGSEEQATHAGADRFSVGDAVARKRQKYSLAPCQWGEGRGEGLRSLHGKQDINPPSFM